MILPHESRDIRTRRESRPVYVYREPYAKWCLPDSEWQRNKLEALRYKWTPYYHDGLRLMQRLGNFGRKWFPWIGAVRPGAVGRMPQ